MITQTKARRSKIEPPLDWQAIRSAAPLAEVELKPQGFFYSITSLFRPGMAPAEAIYSLLAAAAAIDGKISPEESQELTALCHRSRTLAKLGPAKLEVLRASIAPRLERGKIAALIDHAAKSLPGKMRLAVFGHCADLIFADRTVMKSERAFLTRLIALLALPAQQAEDMLRAIRAKNMH
jgi:uncharacterized tellurite resistance protein B-like protein